MKSILKLALLASVAACGKPVSQQLQKKTKTAKPEALFGISHQKVISKKYNSMKVSCDLRFQSGDALNLTSAPTATMIWNLPKDMAEVREIKVSFGNFIGTIKMNIKSFEIIDSIHYTTDDDRVYEMQFSPVITMQKDLKLKHTTVAISENTSAYGMQLNENVGEKIESETFSASFETTKHFKDIRCKLETEIKPAYQDQFVRVR